MTYGTPSPLADLTEKRISKCVSDATGATTKIQVADGIHPISGAQFNGDTDADPENFAQSKPRDTVDHWYMFSPDDTGWDIRGSCAAFATLNKKMVDLLGATGGTVVYIYASTDCSGIEQTGKSSPETTNFVCQGTSYAAELVYCDGGGGPNSWEGTFKITEGATTKYYGGGVSTEGTKPIDILSGVAASQFWIWSNPGSVSSTCKTNVCTLSYSVKDASQPPVPSCP